MINSTLVDINIRFVARIKNDAIHSFVTYIHFEYIGKCVQY